jgi:hypothetical protein
MLPDAPEFVEQNSPEGENEEDRQKERLPKAQGEIGQHGKPQV